MKSLFLFLCLFPVLNWAKTPAYTYQRLSTHLQAGEVNQAMNHLTTSAQENFLLEALKTIARAELPAKKEIIVKGVNGQETIISAASTGIDQLKIPGWLLESEEENAEEATRFISSYRKLLEKSGKSADLLRSLYLLSQHLDRGIFGHSLATDLPESVQAESLVWINFHTEEDPNTRLPLAFKKEGERWLFDGIDYMAMLDLMMTHIERKNLTIEGKDLAGKPISLAQFRDKVMLIDFWGTW